MSGVVGMKDKLLDQVICGVKEDILKNNTPNVRLFLCHVKADQFFYNHPNSKQRGRTNRAELPPQPCSFS